MSICAAIQMVSSPDVEANLVDAERLIQHAAEQGAKLVALPENFAMMGLNTFAKVAYKEVEGQGVIQDFLSRCAQQYNVWLVGGTIPLQATDETKIRAACFVFNAQGERVARYDKVHLFDVHVPETNESYLESNSIEAGNQMVVVETPFGTIGLGVCYDVRFPEFFRCLVERGAEIFIIPAAFTAKTGAVHWEVLLRARAIENMCYVIAPNQGGFHANGRETFGHSFIIDPWGDILDGHKMGEGMACATINRHKLKKIRADFPVLMHRRVINQTIQDNV
jgi:nitrilase